MRGTMSRSLPTINVRQLIFFLVCFIDVAYFGSYGKWIGWSGLSCDDPEIVLTSTYMKVDNRLEIEIGLTDRLRMILIENGTVVILFPGILLDEMELELNFTLQQKNLLQNLYTFYPNSLKISISYLCKFVNFRCSLVCDIGHRLVIMKEHSFIYETGMNESVIDMCTNGHNVEILQNSSDVIRNRWSNLCRNVFHQSAMPMEVRSDVTEEKSDLLLKSSVGCSTIIVLLIVFINLLILFVIQRKMNVRTLKEFICRSFV